MWISCCHEERGGPTDFSEGKELLLESNTDLENGPQKSRNFTMIEGGAARVFLCQQILVPEMHLCH